MRPELQRRIVGSLLEADAAGGTQLADEPLRVPVGEFCDPGRFEREQRAVLRPAPTAACLSCEIPGPGDHVVADAGGVPLLIVRGEDGAARGFVNICRHRGSPVVEGPGERARSFRCRFHGWTYSLHGALVGTPYGDDGFEGLDRSCLGLVPVPVAEAHGLVFARGEGDRPIDVDQWLCGMGDELADFGFAGYHRFDTWVSEWPCNWKLLVDTFLETYHVFALHADTVARYFLVRPSAFAPFGAHLRFHSLQKSFLGLRGTDPSQWELLPHGTVEYLIAPATVLSHSVDHLAMYRFVPRAVDRTTVEMTLATPAPVDTDAQQAHFQRTVELHQRVSGGQDFTQQAKIQRSMASGRMVEAIFGRNEPAAIHFHQSLGRLVEEGCHG